MSNEDKTIARMTARRMAGEQWRRALDAEAEVRRLRSYLERCEARAKETQWHEARHALPLVAKIAALGLSGAPEGTPSQRLPERPKKKTPQA